MKTVVWLGIGLLVIAGLIGVHHFVIAGRFVDVKDVLHHEFFIALFGGVGFRVLLGAYVKS